MEKITADLEDLTLPLEKKMQFAAPLVENKVDRQFKDIKDGPSRSQFSKRVIFSYFTSSSTFMKEKTSLLGQLPYFSY